MEGWYAPALRVLLFTFGAVLGGLGLAFGLGLLLAGPAQAATSPGLPGAATSAVPSTVSSTASTVAASTFPQPRARFPRSAGAVVTPAASTVASTSLPRPSPP